MAQLSLTRRDARRIAVLAQRLDRDRPAGLLELVRHITLLQIDPTAAIAPNAADRRAGDLRVNAIHWDVEPTRAMTAAVDRELRDLARWLELGVVQAA